jgi:hypothetical protein
MTETETQYRNHTIVLRDECGRASATVLKNTVPVYRISDQETLEMAEYIAKEYVDKKLDTVFTVTF